MKIRIASILLAIGMLFSMMSVAFASGMDETAEPQVEEAVEEQEPTAVFYLDGEPLYDVVAQRIGGTYYVTLASMMPLINENAVVEEEADKVTLFAEAVVVTDVEVQVLPEEDTQEENIPEEPTEEPEAEEPGTTLVSIAPGGHIGPVAPVTEEPEKESAEEIVEEVVTTTEAVAEVVDTLILTADVGDQYLVANGRYLYAEGGIVTLEGKVAVPIRLLAEVLNMTVAYNSETGHVDLTSSEEVGYLEDGETFYNEESLYWLSRIIYSESGNQPLAGKIAVGNVVLNRVEDPSFPSTIYDVLFQKNQFSPASSGSIHRDPNEASVIAAKLVLDGAEVMEDALFFNRVGLKCYASRNHTFVATIGGHSFYA